MPSSFARAPSPRTRSRFSSVRSPSSQLDLALEGPGFLRLQGDGELLLGRGGQLSVNREGELTDANGYPYLDPQGQSVRVGLDVSKVVLEQDGTVRGPSGKVGRLDIVLVNDPRKLQRIGGPLYRAPADVQLMPAEETRLLRGQTELPNINAVMEVSAMVTASQT